MDTRLQPGERVRVTFDGTVSFDGTSNQGEALRALLYVEHDSNTYAIPGDAIKSVEVLQTKPAEPLGLGAVVEDAEGQRWVRALDGGECPWVSARDYSQLEEGEGAGSPYDRIDAVRVLSEGVQPC